MIKKIIIAAFILSMTASLNAQPKLTVLEGTTKDWTEVKPEESPLTTDFTIKNTGTELLVISNVRPTCGCTTAPLDRDSLMPGETANLHVSLNIGGSAGKLSKQIRIYSNDPENKTEVITLKANIIRPVSIRPSTYLQFREMQVGTQAQASLFLKNNTSESLTLSNFDVEPMEMSINLIGNVTLAPGEEIELVATVNPKKPGYFNAKVSMNTSNESQKNLTIKGFGKIEESPIFNSN